MYKKTLIGFFMAIALTTAACGLAACNKTPEPDPKPDPSEHTHTFDESKWSMNDTEHWHPATCDHASERGSVAAHSLKDGKCSVCGWTAPVTTDKLEFKDLKLAVWGFEWGPAYNKVVLEFDGDVSDFSKDTFYVALETLVADWSHYPDITYNPVETERTVKDVYASDGMGNAVSGASHYLTIEMEAKNGEASPFSYDFVSEKNSWLDPAPVFVQVKEGKSFKAGNITFTAGEKVKVVTEVSDRIVPQTASWKKDTVTEGSYTLTRASWAPEGADKDSGKNPLVIWLHGAGEGGTDIDIALLGNEVTALTTENETNIQHYFQKDGLLGAYVLAVQTPTMWMDDGTGAYNNSGTGKQESCYTAALWKAITDYVSKNPDVDPDRIYLGGCSNGGYMTMNMMFEHGDYFAAFYPICEAYGDSRIADNMIAATKDYNIWFLLSNDDTTVIPSGCEFPTFMRYLKAGAKNVHMTLTAKVTGKDDPTASYMGHWSWIYAFNDEVKTEFPNSKLTEESQLKPANCIKEANMWEWLAAQKKGVNPAPTTPDPELPGGTVTPGPSGELMEATVFECEEGVIQDGAQTVTVESGTVYHGTEQVTNLGYFHSGATLTFTIYADAACDATLTLYAASAAMSFGEDSSMMIGETDLSTGRLLKLFVNDEQVTMNATLPGADDMSDFAAAFKNFVGVQISIHLKEGENVIKFTTDQSQGTGVNMDRIEIDAPCTLKWRPTDNSGRPSTNN